MRQTWILLYLIFFVRAGCATFLYFHYRARETAAQRRAFLLSTLAVTPFYIQLGMAFRAYFNSCLTAFGLRCQFFSYAFDLFTPVGVWTWLTLVWMALFALVWTLFVLRTQVNFSKYKLSNWYY